MKKFKSIIVLVLAVITFCLPLGACAEPAEITFCVPDGAPLLSVYSFTTQQKASHNLSQVKIETVTGAQIAARLISENAPQIAAAPINLCAKTYADTDGAYVLAGVAMWGNLNIIARTQIDGLEDLVGEILYAFQKTNTPGLTLKALITMSGLEYKEIENDSAADPEKINIMYLASTVTVRGAMLNGLEGKPATHYKFGMLAEPLASSAVIMSEGELTNAISLNQIYKSLTGSSFAQVGILVQKDLALDSGFMQKLINALKAASSDINASPLAAANEILNDFTTQELPSAESIAAFVENSGSEVIKFTTGIDAKTEVAAYLQKLVDMDGAPLIGGQLPDDGFYFAP